MRWDGEAEEGKISQECSEGVRIEMTGGGDGKMMTMTLYPSQRGFCIVVLAGKPVLLLPCKILDITILTYKPSRKKYI